MLLSHALVTPSAPAQCQQRCANPHFDPLSKIAVDREAEQAMIKVFHRCDVLTQDDCIVQIANTFEHRMLEQTVAYPSFYSFLVLNIASRTKTVHSLGVFAMEEAVFSPETRLWL